MQDKNKQKIIIFIGGLLIILASICFILSKGTILKSKEEATENKVAEFVKQYKQEEIVFYESFDEKVTSLVVKVSDKYEAFMFDYLTGAELETQNIIKKDKWDEFVKKIQSLIYLKYPVFIAEALINNENNVYCFQKNKLTIYFYDVKTEPKVEEELALDVNYNEIYEFLDFTVSLDKDYQNEDGSLIDENKKHMAITFDDGPSQYTSNLVDILDQNKAQCTFFMLGSKIINKKEVVQKVFQSKHEIGYHSYNHQNLIREDKNKIIEEYNMSNEYLKSIIAQEFTLTRPPYGSINSNVKSALDTPFILWSIDTNDWRYKDVDYLVNYVLDNAKDGAIILFHDTHKTSIEAIAKLLPELYVRDYQLLSVSNLAKIKGETLENHQSYRHF